MFGEARSVDSDERIYRGLQKRVSLIYLLAACLNRGKQTNSAASPAGAGARPAGGALMRTRSFGEMARRQRLALRSILSIGFTVVMSGCLVHSGYSAVASDMTPEDVKRIVVSREFVSQIVATGGVDVFFDFRMGIDRVPEGGLELRERGPSSERSLRVHRGADAHYAIEIPGIQGSWQRSWPPPRYSIDFIASASAEGPMVVRAGRYVMLISHGAGHEPLRRDEVDLAQVIGIHSPMSYALFLGVDRVGHRPGVSLTMLPVDDAAIAVGHDGYRISATVLRTHDSSPRGMLPSSSWSSSFVIMAEKFKIP